MTLNLVLVRLEEQLTHLRKPAKHKLDQAGNLVGLVRLVGWFRIEVVGLKLVKLVF